MTNANETQKPLEILVVEDNEKHLADAKAEVARLQASGTKMNVVYATDYVSAQEAMQARNYDKIVSDVFFPESKERISSNETIQACKEILGLTNMVPPKLYERIIAAWECGQIKPEEKVGCGKQFAYQAIEKWSNGKDLAPLGVLVANEARQRKIPVVLCSSVYHHGFAVQPICEYTRKVGIPFVDGGEYTEEDRPFIYEKEVQRKDWKAAFEAAFNYE